MKKAVITVELVPEADVVPDDIIKTQIEENAKIPWMRKILEVKIEKSGTLKKW